LSTPSDDSSDLPDWDVEDMRQTFRDYASSGRDARWQGREPGARLATDERDRWLFDAAGSFAHGVVVDLGCGDANVALVLAREGIRPKRYIGIDIMEERLAIAAARVPWGEFIQASATTVPVPDASVDLVVACLLFSSLPIGSPREKASNEIRRILRPGGRALIYDLRFPSPSNKAVRPFGAREIGHHFEGWPATASTLTLLPPLARNRFVSSARRYRTLAGIPWLRSHVGVVLSKPS
jgi:ubiquinone/menaquinone biosynthesis C-methylase UbiE